MSGNLACRVCNSKETIASTLCFQLKHLHPIVQRLKQLQIFHPMFQRHFAHLVLKQSKTVGANEMTGQSMHLAHS